MIHARASRTERSELRAKPRAYADERGWDGREEERTIKNNEKEVEVLLGQLRLNSDSQRKIIDHVIDSIIEIKNDAGLLVAFDGVDTAGKTTLANAVSAALLERRLFHPVRISIDKFHNSKEVRLAKGELSPDGFFHDSFNYAKIIQCIISPVKNRLKSIVPGVFEYQNDREIVDITIPIDDSSVILFDGIFMNREELFRYWDLSVFLDVSFDTVMTRALQRDEALFGSRENVITRYKARYIPGEKIYLELCRPKERADIVIDNNDYNKPVIIKRWTKRIDRTREL